MSATAHVSSRRDVLKWSTLAAAALAMPSGLTSCAADAPPAAKAAGGMKTGGVHNLNLLSNEWCTVMSDAASRAANYLGCGSSETTFDTDETMALSQGEQAIVAGSKMMFIQGADGSSIPALAKMANDKKIYFNNMWVTAPWFMPFDAGDYYVSFFAGSDDVNFYESTKAMLTKLVAAKGPRGKIVYVTGLPGAGIEMQRQRAAKRALAEFPGLELVGSLPGKWSAEGGQEATAQLVSRYGKPDGVIAQNDGSLTGVLAALNGLGMHPGEDVFCCGADGASDILKQIQAGTVASTAFTSPAYFGVLSVVRVFDALNGVQLTPAERQMGVTGLTATSENVDGLITRYVDNKNLPFDPILMSKAISGDKWDPMMSLAPLDQDKYWGDLELAKPKGFEYPQAYKNAVDNGDLDKVAAQYKVAYKVKADDTTYRGVKA